MASEEQPPSLAVFADAADVMPVASIAEPPPKKRKGGRRKDDIWQQTTVHPDKTVECNRCHAVIHRYGTTKVERVRAHFERKCLQSKRPKLSHDADGRAIAYGADARASRPGYGSKNGMFKRRFAEWMYATGQPFDAVESELLLTALRVIRGDVALPTKLELENELLDMEFAASQMKVTKALSGKPCCLTVESWVDAGRNAVTSYGARCENASYFLESMTIASQEPGAELSADDVESVLAKHKKSVFNGVVTPTTSMLSKFTRERIQKKHPQCVFYHGCVCHALQLLTIDVSCVLPWLDKVHASVTELTKVFHGNHKLQSLVSSTQSSPSTDFPDSSSVYASLESVLNHEKELYTIVARRDFVEASTPAEQEKLKRVQDFVLGESFVQDLTNSLAILRHLEQHLQHFQEERVPISHVFPYFMDLLNAYSSMEWVNKKEKALITSCVMERFNAVYGNSHGVAYTLDPLYLGEGLDAGKTQEVEAFIVRYCTGEGQGVDILAQLAKYKDMVADLKENNQAYWQLLVSGAVPPYDFWVERRQFPHLQQLAWAVFALPVSSSCPSQAFGAQSNYVHERFHNTLSPEKLQKLTHVYCNLKNKVNSEPPSLSSEVI